jgi:hypothetical protein
MAKAICGAREVLAQAAFSVHHCLPDFGGWNFSSLQEVK